MKGLKVIPFFLLLICLTYAGVLFVEANRDPVVVKFTAETATPPLALGLVVLSAALIGMAICGLFCSVEMLALYFQNKNLKKRLATRRQDIAPVAEPGEIEHEPMQAQNHY